MERLKVSVMSGKLRGIRSLNTTPFQNTFCKSMAKAEGTICSSCYSQRMLRGLRRNCNEPWKKNGMILSKRVISDKQVPALKKDKVFRFSAHGELLNRTHAINLYKIAESKPHILFTLWTKRVNLVRGLSKPANLILIYSTPEIDELNPAVPEGFDKVFSVYTKKFTKDNGVEINCKGKCVDCMLCYSHNKVSRINEVLK